MEPVRKAVLFMNYGTWGGTSLETQDRNVELYAEMLQGESVDVEMAQDLAAGEALLRARQFDAVIFRTRGEEHVARRIKREHPDVRVAVLSALVPFAERSGSDLVWISKTAVETPADFARAVLG